MENNVKSKSNVGRTLGILMIIFVLIVIAIAVPGWVCYRPHCACRPVEEDAHNIAAAMADYLSDSGNPHITLTKEDIEKLVNVSSPWTLTRCGDDYYIHVIDRKRKCPAEFQNQYPEWHANVYTLKF